MSFRECVNCDYVTCTIRRVCLLGQNDPTKQQYWEDLTKEALQIAALQQKLHKPVSRRTNFFAPAPLAGYARRKRKNGSYGNCYNFLHTGNWHGVIRFFKNN
jgi:hypothetical protein